MNRHEPGPRSKRIVEEEQRHMSPGLQSIALYSGLAMAQGTGSTLIDEDGKRYLDFVAGIGVGSVGHCHPHYVEALKQQVERLTFTSFTTEVRARFLNLVASVTPKGLSRIQMFSGGAEAVEAAFRLAKSATRRFEFIGFWGGFHGKSGGVLGLLGDDFKKQLGPFMPGLYSSPYAHCYRCPWKLSFPSCGLACAEHLRHVIRYETQGEIAAIIVEPVQGTAGNVVPPPGFLSAVRDIAKEHGALLIADEMQTGFGRTGSMWGCDHDGVIPDIMTVGKGIAGGFPLELRRKPPRISGRPGHFGNHHQGRPREECRACGGRDDGAAPCHAGTVSVYRRCPRERVDAQSRIGAGPRDERTAFEGCDAGPLPGMFAPGIGRHVLCTHHTNQSAFSHQRRPGPSGTRAVG